MAKQARVLPIWIKVKVKGLQDYGPTTLVNGRKAISFEARLSRGYVNEEGSYMELNTHISGAKNKARWIFAFNR